MAPDLTDFEDTHTHELRTSPLVKGLVVAFVILAAAVVILGWHVTQRQALADKRQTANVAAQQQRNAEFEATRDAQCYLIAYSAHHVTAPIRRTIRVALANAALRAGCAQIVYRANHPNSPAVTPPPQTALVPGPTMTATTTVTVTPSPQPPRTPSPDGASTSPLCTDRKRDE